MNYSSWIVILPGTYRMWDFLYHMYTPASVQNRLFRWYRNPQIMHRHGVDKIFQNTEWMGFAE